MGDGEKGERDGRKRLIEIVMVVVVVVGSGRYGGGYEWVVKGNG